MSLNLLGFAKKKSIDGASLQFPASPSLAASQHTNMSSGSHNGKRKGDADSDAHAEEEASPSFRPAKKFKETHEWVQHLQTEQEEPPAFFDESLPDRSYDDSNADRDEPEDISTRHGTPESLFHLHGASPLIIPESMSPVHEDGSPLVEAARGQPGTTFSSPLTGHGETMDTPAQHDSTQVIKEDSQITKDYAHHNMRGASCSASALVEKKEVAPPPVSLPIELSDSDPPSQQDTYRGQQRQTQYWFASLNDEDREKALASCAPSAWIGDDVINALLEMLTSCSPHLRTLNALQVSPEITQHTIDLILPFYENGESSGALDHIELTFGFQPVPNHWVLAWLDLGSRTADIYDSKPTDPGSPQACQKVRDIIQMLPPPFNNNNNGEMPWTIKLAPFPTQSNSTDCGIYAIAAAFYRAAGLSPPNASQTLDTDLWRLLCKSMLMNLTSQGQGKSSFLTAALRSYVPEFNDNFPVPQVPATLDSAATHLAADSLATTVQAYLQHAQALQTAARDVFSSRSAQTNEAAGRIRFVREKLIPRTDTENEDDDSLQTWAERLTHNAKYVRAALPTLDNCQPVKQGAEDFTGLISALRAKLATVETQKRAVQFRIITSQHARKVFAGMGEALGLIAEETAQVAKRYKNLIPEVD